MIAGTCAIKDNDYYMDNCKRIAKTRERVTAELRAMGFEVIDSSANFIFARSADIDGESLYLELKKRGILVRHFGKERSKDYNRMTIGTQALMEVCGMTIADFLKGEAL